MASLLQSVVCSVNSGSSLMCARVDSDTFNSCPVEVEASGSSITCVFPPLNDDVETLENISYTIEVGGAAGPNLSLPALNLNLRPNPVFPEDGTALVDNEYTIGSNTVVEVKVGLYMVTALDMMYHMIAFRVPIWIV